MAPEPRRNRRLPAPAIHRRAGRGAQAFVDSGFLLLDPESPLGASLLGASLLVGEPESLVFDVLSEEEDEDEDEGAGSLLVCLPRLSVR
jgi:hypothetical protein